MSRNTRANKPLGPPNPNPAAIHPDPDFIVDEDAATDKPLGEQEEKKSAKVTQNNEYFKEDHRALTDARTESDLWFSDIE